MNNNLSISVQVSDKKTGEIIHWEKTGVIESWHYNDNTVEISFFDEKDIAVAVRFAKHGNNNN